VSVIAHIGNVPVEESLPFLVPIIALYLYGRHRGRRRREALKRLPEARAALDDQTIGRVLDRWSSADHRDLLREHVSLLYPPGPEGATASELASRLHGEPSTIGRLLDDLAEQGYVEFDSHDNGAERRAWLTVSGYDLVRLTEDEVLAHSRGQHPSAQDRNPDRT
jgi:DNA-binding transcriptional ArsR family regulator